MKTLIDLFRPGRGAANAAAEAGGAPSALFADLAYAGASDIGPVQRLAILNEADAVLSASMKDGADVEAYKRCTLILEAIVTCRKLRNLYL